MFSCKRTHDGLPKLDTPVKLEDDANCKDEAWSEVDEEQTQDTENQCSIEELCTLLQDSDVLSGVKKTIKDFHRRQTSTFRTDNCCYVAPSYRRRKYLGTRKFGEQVLPARDVLWQQLADPSFVVFDKQLFATVNLPFFRFDSKEIQNDAMVNTVAVVQGYYSPKPSLVSVCHLSSFCVNQTSAPYYLQLDADVENPFQFLFPVCAQHEANCEIVSVHDNYLKIEILLLRTTRAIPIGGQLRIHTPHSITHITTSRGYGRRLTWLKQVRVED